MGSPLSLTQSLGGLSLWHETTPTDWTPRPALDGDVEADVAIVGAGYTGLWTAYYLARPTRRCGSWWSRRRSPASAPRGATAAGARRCSRRALGEAQDAAMRASVDEVAAGDPRRGHRLPLRQGRHHRARAQQGPAHAGARASTATRCSPPPRPASGCARPGPSARRTPPTARPSTPARLVRGLADVVTRRGVALHERTPALSIEPGVVRTPPRIGAGAVRRARDGGFHARGCPGWRGRWCRSTR